jgi:hypothetical protein
VSTTSEISHDFDFLFGRWQVDHRRRRTRLGGPDAWDRSPGEMTCRPILDGLGNCDEFLVPELGPIGSTLRLFDLAAKRWSIHWSSRSTGRLEPPLHGAFQDGVGLFYGDDVHEGRPITVRFIWEAPTPHTARWQQAFSADAGTTWETNWVMELTR